ncbi:MAG: class I SAM-dependent methyltransferase, partial [Dehalococcoidia bacterium]
MTTQALDQAKAEAFGGEMVAMLNHACLALLTSIGHQTGLFETLADLPPSTSAQIAAVAALDERYVREWLGAMTVGRIVEYDPTTRTYRLPPEHAASLTRAAGPDNFAYFMQYIPELGAIESQVIESFRNGGGVPYAAIPRFQALQHEETAALYDAALIDVMLPLAPSIVERLTEGIAVADYGCGAGHAVNLMARAFPTSRFTGYDVSAVGVAMARRAAAAWGLTNADFVVADVATLDLGDAFDLITAFDTIHDQAHPAAVLRSIARALRSDGSFFMVDIAASSNLEENLEHPLGPLLYTASTLHCMTVSLA